MCSEVGPVRFFQIITLAGTATSADYGWNILLNSLLVPNRITLELDFCNDQKHGVNWMQSHLCLATREVYMWLRVNESVVNLFKTLSRRKTSDMTNVNRTLGIMGNHSNLLYFRRPTWTPHHQPLWLNQWSSGFNNLTSFFHPLYF